MALTKLDISMMLNTGTTANKLLVNDGSGNLPAVDGSQLTNVNTGITNSASDLEELLKELKVTPRCIPVDGEADVGDCIFTGKPGSRLTVFAKAY